MKLFKSPTKEIFAYEEDDSQDYLIPSDFVKLTQTEIDAREAKFAQDKADVEKAKQAAKDAKDSALAKLAKLGLTEDEVKALIG